MPELPEVETIRRGLEKYIVGKRIISLKILDNKLLQGHQFHLAGGKVVAVKRFGKGLVIDLHNGYSIAAHIKMTGQFIYQGNITKHSRAVIEFEDNNKLLFNDIRRFGWLKIVKTSGIKNLPFFKQLGPEPFRNLTLIYFRSMVKKNKSPIKSLLMNQTKISGLGNIYTNDALNLAKINPLRKSSSLKETDIKLLYRAIHEVLKRGLEFGGASQTNYLNVLGQKGQYQQHFLVYDCEGEKCYNCGNIIKKTRLAGRGTFFCPNCQH